MECSAKKGGEDISGDAGIFGKVVDKVSIFFLSPLLSIVNHQLTRLSVLQLLVDTGSLYTKSPTVGASGSGGKKRADGGRAPPGGFPGRGGTVSLDDEMSGEGGSWCAC